MSLCPAGVQSWSAQSLMLAPTAVRCDTGNKLEGDLLLALALIHAVGDMRRGCLPCVL